MFVTGKSYSKKDIYQLLDVPANKQHGAWDTGYRKYAGDFYVFANVGIAGRTGHDYVNFWDGDLLHWEAKSSSRLAQPLIQDLINPLQGSRIYIFTRIENKNPFTFEGLGTPLEVIDDKPVKIIWELNEPESDLRMQVMLPEEALNYPEGAVKKVLVNKYERNPLARRICIQHFGPKCSICGFDYASFYGKLGDSYIHVHHIVPLSEIRASYELNPIRDLVPVCANCHSMIHRKKIPLSVADLKNILNERHSSLVTN